MNIKSDNELIENDYGISVDKIVTSFIMPATRPSSGIPKGIDETRFRAGRIHMMHEAAVKKQKQDSYFVFSIYWKNYHNGRYFFSIW